MAPVMAMWPNNHVIAACEFLAKRHPTFQQCAISPTPCGCIARRLALAIDRAVDLAVETQTADLIETGFSIRTR